MIQALKKPRGPRLDFKHGRIDMTHGSGGRAMAQLIDQLFLPAFSNPYLNQKNDQACFKVHSGKMVITTDAHVISPLFFPGGDIGCLSVHGTINDIAMSGAQPLYLSASFILEEGFPLSDLKRIVDSMANAAGKANVMIIAGDTKVVERGKGDGVFITTTGIGIVPESVDFRPDKIKKGDHVLINGYIGEHGVAVMAQRNNLQFSAPVLSDTAALHELVATMVNSKANIRCMRDPTRGGVGTTLNEWASQAQLGFYIEEEKLHTQEAVMSCCELLGLDPLYVANEGKLLAICAPEDSTKLLNAMRAHPLGQHAQIIGYVTEDPRQFVQLKTKLGGMRIVDWLTGEQLPRIC